MVGKLIDWEPVESANKLFRPNHAVLNLSIHYLRQTTLGRGVEIQSLEVRLTIMPGPLSAIGHVGPFLGGRWR